MPRKYFIEMICDRVAASMTYLGDKYTDDAPLQYYESHKDENQFHPETRHALEEMLEMIASEGISSIKAQNKKEGTNK
jgi:hypothetical protein